jgi:ATP-dependent helicase/nuclease subunit A
MSALPDVHRLDRALFVEAGAGTGKTTAIVERVVALVQEGVPVTSIAAITFTESAAAELRARVRVALEDAGASGALDDLDDAPLLTVHAFAQRLLAAHAVAAGLPPVLEVRDEVEAAIAFDREWAAFADRLLSDPALAPTMGAAMALGLEERHLRALARAFHDHWDSLVDRPFAPAGLSGTHVDVDVSELVARLGRLDAAADGCIDASDRLCRHLREAVLPFAARLQAAAGGSGDGGDERDGGHALLDVLAGAADLRAGNRGQAPKWRRPTKATVVQLLDAAEQERQAVLEGVRRRLLDLVAEEVRRFTLARAAQRRADGVLEFHDLLVLARDLLAGDAAVLAEVREEIAHVLVDELQDVDPLQAELALLLGGDDPDRLFFVGDPKQSIYRFRRADLAVYGALREAFAGSVVPLATNHRSTAGVIRWVGRVFERLFADGGDGQARWSGLVAVRPQRPDAGPPVVTFGGAGAVGETVAALREREAADVVDVVRRAVGDPWLVEDADGGGWRPARLDDIAVLLPTRTALPAIERALDDAGIPSRVESRSLVWATQEARDLLALLRAIDDPSDQVAVVAALRTPALACSDRDLLDAVTAGLRWDEVADGARVAAVLPDAATPVRRGLDALAQYRAARRDLPFTALIERVVRELRLLELGMAGPRPREAWNRVRFVVDQARAFADRGQGATLRAFVDWAERQADEKARALETVMPEHDHVAVRITTVHAAKGREFPIVIVAGLSVEGEPYRDAAVVWRTPGGGPPALRLGRADLGWASAGWDAAKAGDAAAERQEDDRLAYVACTRARDHLCVSLHHRAGAGGRSSIAARLHAALVGVGRRAAGGADLSSLPLVLPLGEDAAPAMAVPPPLPVPTAPPVVGAPSASPSSSPVPAPAALGAPVGASSTSPSASADASPAAAPIDLRFASRPVVEAEANGRSWHGVRVLVDDGGSGGPVEHVVDLVYEHGDGLVVVAFDEAESDGPDQWRERLHAQAAALRQVLPGRPVVRAVLVR